MKSKLWLVGWFIPVVIVLVLVGMEVYSVDPYMQYGKPQTDTYHYELDNERSMNIGIIKNFDYDAIITGTSMCQNFKASEVDELFGVNSIKTCFAGGPYYEINNNLAIALSHNPNIKLVVRGLDYGMMSDASDRMRDDMGEYPTYLYDDNYLNDVKYLFNRDVVFDRVYNMEAERSSADFKPGIPSFDEYDNWQKVFTFGVNSVLPDGASFEEINHEDIEFTDEDARLIRENITRNVTSLADEYPDVQFYYFFTPYSVAWWNDCNNYRTTRKLIEGEKLAIELILEKENIHLFSLNTCAEIVTDINNYKDLQHYAEWVNSLVLLCMKEGKYQLTRDNYEEYLEEELKLYTEFDYESIMTQPDYEDDFEGVAALYESLGFTYEP